MRNIFPICRNDFPYLSKRLKTCYRFVAAYLLICRADLPYLSTHVTNLSPNSVASLCTSITYKPLLIIMN